MPESRPPIVRRLSAALAACLGAPLSLLWGAAVGVRGWLFRCGVLPSRSFGLPVICVGNLAVGGTGKTPHVEYILRLLHAEGYRVAMLSRGYGRRTRGYLLAEAGHSAADIGDEPYQISRNCPFATVAVCERRVAGIEQLLRLPLPPQVIVLDDAFQHRYVRPGFSVLLTEARRPYTRDHLLPWGRLREPASAAQRAQAVVVTKCEGGERPSLPVQAGQSLFYSRIVYAPNQSAADPSRSASCAGQRVLLVAGIANPEPLRRHLLSQGAAEVSVLAFPDHHAFTAADAVRIGQAYRAACAQLAVTTQKDMTRLAPLLPLLDEPLRSHLYVQPITVEVSPAHPEQTSFHQTLIDYVSTHSTNRRVD